MLDVYVIADSEHNFVKILVEVHRYFDNELKDFPINSVRILHYATFFAEPKLKSSQRQNRTIRQNKDKGDYTFNILGIRHNTNDGVQ